MYFEEHYLQPCTFSAATAIQQLQRGADETTTDDENRSDCFGLRLGAELLQRSQCGQAERISVSGIVV